MASTRRAPTILDVASAAGVSKSTASRALSGASDIQAQTRDLVVQAANRIGYERNLLARSMRSGRSHMIGLVIPDLANTFWAELARGAQDRADAAGYALLLCSSDWAPARETSHLRALRQARVDGIILNPVRDSDASAPDFTAPCVMIGSSAERFEGHSSVGSDIHQGVLLGMQTLYKQGHHKPALILGPKSRLARARFLRAVHDFCVSKDIDPASLQIEESPYSVEGGQEAMARLLLHPQGRPSAVFCANDMIAIGAVQHLREKAVLVPDEISVLGFDGISSAAHMWPPLTTIRKPAREIGSEAVAELLAHIEGSTIRPRRQLLACHLISGGTVGRRRF